MALAKGRVDTHCCTVLVGFQNKGIYIPLTYHSSEKNKFPRGTIPIGSMYGIFSYVYIVDFFGKLVGKYTSPMDPMGYTSRRLRHVLLLTKPSSLTPEDRPGPKGKDCIPIIHFRCNASY